MTIKVTVDIYRFENAFLNDDTTPPFLYVLMVKARRSIDHSWVGGTNSGRLE
jgi:hypothetical protein